MNELSISLQYCAAVSVPLKKWNRLIVFDIFLPSFFRCKLYYEYFYYLEYFGTIYKIPLVLDNPLEKAHEIIAAYINEAARSSRRHRSANKAGRF